MLNGMLVASDLDFEKKRIFSSGKDFIYSREDGKAGRDDLQIRFFFPSYRLTGKLIYYFKNLFLAGKEILCTLAGYEGKKYTSP